MALADWQPIALMREMIFAGKEGGEESKQGQRGQKREAEENPRPIVMWLFYYSGGFNLADLLRQLYRPGGQLIRGEVVNVNAAQAAGLRSGKNGGFFLID